MKYYPLHWHIGILACWLIISINCTQPRITPEVQTDKPVALFPDYTGVTFPSNIAPPNFRILAKNQSVAARGPA